MDEAHRTIIVPSSFIEHYVSYFSSSRLRSKLPCGRRPLKVLAIIAEGHTAMTTCGGELGAVAPLDDLAELIREESVVRMVYDIVQKAYI